MAGFLCHRDGLILGVLQPLFGFRPQFLCARLCCGHGLLRLRPCVLQPLLSLGTKILRLPNGLFDACVDLGRGEFGPTGQCTPEIVQIILRHLSGAQHGAENIRDFAADLLVGKLFGRSLLTAQKPVRDSIQRIAAHVSGAIFAANRGSRATGQLCDPTDRATCDLAYASDNATGQLTRPLGDTADRRTGCFDRGPRRIARDPRTA